MQSKRQNIVENRSKAKHESRLKNLITSDSVENRDITITFTL